MNRALLVGIDSYDNFAGLKGCVNDVLAIEPLLARNENGTPNFACRAMTTNTRRIERRDLLSAIDELFSPGADVALFYFAGHGAPADSDVVLVTQDGAHNDAGVPLSAILGKVQTSNVREAIIILDCCFSGAAGGVPQLSGNLAAIKEGVSILTASRSDQPAAETPFHRGLFSVYLCGALDGGAADVLGKVNLSGVYAYLSESFGPWNQRPTFKANVDRLHLLRSCSPAVPLDELRRLPDFFADPNSELGLDPSYEPDAEPDHPEHEAVFKILQKCRSAKLVEPVGADHLFFAAIESKSCRLTPLGKLYHRMAALGQI